MGYSIEHQTALQYIEEFAAKIKLPVVVNLSQGMSAGAHDGKSALEASFDSFSGFGRKRGRIIVKSAGNERGEDGHEECPGSGQPAKERFLAYSGSREKVQ